MELMKINTYQEFNAAFGLEVRKQSEGFIRIGYLLKRARDTDILSESGYKTIAEYAWAEYRFSDDAVSRMIHINDRYSVDGYSDQLQDKYKVYGMSLLAEMLTLPEKVVDVLPPGITRQEIRQIKTEIKEESKITDLEVILEGEKPELKELDSKLEKFFRQYYHENRTKYAEMYASLKDEPNPDQIYNELAPSGIATMITRIQGLGKYMLSIKSRESDLELLNIRDNSKEAYTWEECAVVLSELCQHGDNAEESWETMYGEPFHEPVHATAPPAPKPEEKPKPKIAPAQPAAEPERKTEPTRPEKNKEHINHKTESHESEPEIVEEKPQLEPEIAPAQEENQKEASTEASERFHQNNIEEFDEVLPEGYIKCHDGSEVLEERIQTRYEALTMAESITEMAAILSQADNRNWYEWLEAENER